MYSIVYRYLFYFPMYSYLHDQAASHSVYKCNRPLFVYLFIC